ncbi:MAG: hypothetical protein E7287_03545 [Lachnospiraceae bacterium]|nr:hypothetical protein [Lachnospiraceae bacterium]
MKTWKTAEVVELSIKETAHGQWDSYVEFSHNGVGWNNDLFDGKDSDGDGNPGKDDGNNSSTPDTLS